MVEVPRLIHVYFIPSISPSIHLSIHLLIQLILFLLSCYFVLGTLRGSRNSCLTESSLQMSTFVKQFIKHFHINCFLRTLQEPVRRLVY